MLAEFNVEETTKRSVNQVDQGVFLKKAMIDNFNQSPDAMSAGAVLANVKNRKCQYL
jgi:hypothetical protein